MRIGDDFETGVPAESFEILDINMDGNRDIRLRWVLDELEAAGHLPVGITTIEVWGQDPATGDEYRGEAEVEVIEPVPPGEGELIVLNDRNVFDNIALDDVSAQNRQFVRNIVNFTSDGPRDDGTVVWWDWGRDGPAISPEAFTEAVATIEGEDYDLQIIESAEGTLVDIPIDVRSLWLWHPRVFYTTAELNALKQFVAEGGRLVFIGEWGAFYGAQGLATMNDFLERMGSTIRTLGGLFDVGRNVTPHIFPHQTTQGVFALALAGVGELSIGAEDDIIFQNSTAEAIVGAAGLVDLTPLTGRERFEGLFGPYHRADPRADPRSDTGQ